MNRLLVVLALALVVMSGCMAEEPGYDDVASQVSAVEEAPAPMSEEDMRTVRGYCRDACGQAFIDRNGMCYEVYMPRASGGDMTLFSNCMDSSSRMSGECNGRCERMWGGGGDIGVP